MRKLEATREFERFLIRQNSQGRQKTGRQRLDKRGRNIFPMNPKEKQREAVTDKQTLGVDCRPAAGSPGEMQAQQRFLHW